MIGIIPAVFVAEKSILSLCISVWRRLARRCEAGTYAQCRLEHSRLSYAFLLVEQRHSVPAEDERRQVGIVNQMVMRVGSLVEPLHGCLTQSRLHVAGHGVFLPHHGTGCPRLFIPPACRHR